MNEEGFSVTECLGGSMELAEEELPLRYQVHSSFFFSLLDRGHVCEVLGTEADDLISLIVDVLRSAIEL